MSIDTIKDAIPDFAKDIRMNLGSILTDEGTLGLTREQKWGTALAVAASAGNLPLLSALSSSAASILSEAHVEAAKSAAAIMAMNNVYYRTMHQIGDRDIEKLPAKLRMSVIGKPGITKVDFDLYCLAVSAVNGCAACVAAHTREVKEGSISSEGIHSAIRIAAVVKAAADVLRLAT